MRARRLATETERNDGSSDNGKRHGQAGAALGTHDQLSTHAFSQHFHHTAAYCIFTERNLTNKHWRATVSARRRAQTQRQGEERALAQRQEIPCGVVARTKKSKLELGRIGLFSDSAF